MTATAPLTNLPLRAPVGITDAARERIWSRDVVSCFACVGLLACFYTALANPFWVPGGDSEVYVSIARSLASGKGYLFNGQPVSMVPPGWPLLLAGVMKLSASFYLLKFLTMLCMLGSLSIGYWICRRFATPEISALAILLSGIISHVYSLTFWLHSDALFCLVSAAAILIAMQINEGIRPRRWRLIALPTLCAATVLVRWAGVFTWLLVAASLIDGLIRPKLDRRWIILIVSGIVTAGTFLTLRHELKVTPAVAARLRSFGGTAEDNDAAALGKADANLATSYSIFNPASHGVRGLIGRATNWPTWYSFLLWQPLRMGRSHSIVSLAGLILGWAVVIPLLIYVGYETINHRRWIWAALIVYTLALAMNWPQPNARYLVPIAPLIMLGVLRSFDLARERLTRPIALRASKVTLGYFIASVLICNVALWGVDVWVAHADDFYRKYEAGLNRDMVSASAWLIDHGARDGEIAVSQLYVNLGRSRTSPAGLRAASMLTNCAIVSIPKKYAAYDPRHNQKFLDWARDAHIKYFLYQPEISPWRVFHFRMGWLQELMTHEPAIDSGSGWRLYIVPLEKPGEDVNAERVSLEPAKSWPVRVPGI